MCAGKIPLFLDPAFNLLADCMGGKVGLYVTCFFANIVNPLRTTGILGFVHCPVF